MTNISVRTSNCQVPARLRDHAVDRVRHATRFFDRVLAVEVVFANANASDGSTARVEVRGVVKGHLLRAAAAADDFRRAVDLASERFERLLARHKDKLVGRSRPRERGERPIVGEYEPSTPLRE